MAAKKILGDSVVLPEMDPTTPEQEALIDRFVADFFTDKAACPAAYHYLFDGYGPLLSGEAIGEEEKAARLAEARRIVAYKYLIARKWKMADAVTMFMDTSAWREREGYDMRPFFPSAMAIRGYDAAEIASFLRHGERPVGTRIDLITNRMYGAYSNAIHKWDKQGHPVVYEMPGVINVPLSLTALKELAAPADHFAEPMVVFRAYENELVNALIRYNDEKFATTINKASGRRVTSVTVVFDCAGFQLSMATTETLDLIKRILELDQKRYPEILHRMVVVNCSAMVMMVYNIVKVVLDARVRTKFVFVGPEDTNAVLRELIDEEHLPEKYGGTCRCSCGGEGEAPKDPSALSSWHGGGCIYTRGQDGKDNSDGSAYLRLPGGEGIPTRNLDIYAGAEETKTISLKAGERAVWEWASVNDHQVEFSASFASAAAAEVSLFAKARSLKEKGEYIAPADGEVRLVFGNGFSMFRAKTIRLRIGAI